MLFHLFLIYIDAMSISFDKKDNREKYLTGKLDDLTSQINNLYGKTLYDELVIRLKDTIDDFNEEVQSMTEKLKSSTEKRSQLIEKIKSSIDERDEEAESIETLETEPENRELTEWEKRLESIEMQR